MSRITSVSLSLLLGLVVLLFGGCKERSSDKVLFASSVQLKKSQPVQTEFHSDINYDQVGIFMKLFNDLPADIDNDTYFLYRKIFTDVGFSIVDKTGNVVVVDLKNLGTIDYGPASKTFILSSFFPIVKDHDYVVTFSPGEKFADRTIEIYGQLIPYPEL